MDNEPQLSATRRQQESNIPQRVRAQIIALRIAGHSIREIAKRTGRGTHGVMDVLKSPEAQRQLAAASEEILRNYRQQALDLIPEALQGAKELIRKRDRYLIAKAISGSRVWVERSEQQVESVGGTPEYTRAEREHFLMFGHFPGEGCGKQCRDNGKGESK